MKECFIITPIGANGSQTRRDSDGLVKSVFMPVLSEFNLKPVVAHQISETGSITRQIIKRILESDMVIANLTELNPNVMYEVGIRHCARKSMIVIAKEGTILPFDLSDERTIFYQNDMFGSEELKEQLRVMIPRCLEETTVDNPVYRVVDVDLIKLPEGTPDVSVLADRKFTLIEDQLEEIKVGLRRMVDISPYTRNSIPRKFGLNIGGLLSDSQSNFSVLAESLDRFTPLQEFCDEYSIKCYARQVKDESYKFSAICESAQELKKLENLAKKLGLTMVKSDFI